MTDDRVRALALADRLRAGGGAALTACGEDETRRATRRSGQTLTRLLRTRGGDRRAALRDVRAADRDQGRGALRRQRRARGDDRRGGRAARPTSSSPRTPGRSAPCRARARLRQAAGRDARPRAASASATRRPLGRARPAACGSSRTTRTRSSEDERPDSISMLHGPGVEGQDRLPPTNASFQAFVTAMRLTRGRRARRASGSRRSGPTSRSSTRRTSQVARGAGRPARSSVGLRQPLLPLPAARRSSRTRPSPTTTSAGGDPGALVNVAGVGVLAARATTRRRREQFVEFLLSDEGQRFYAEEAEEAEYPLVAGIEPKEGLPPLGVAPGPDVALGRARAASCETTLEMLSEVGFTS